MPEVQMATASSENTQIENYSPEYLKYIQERVKQSPLKISGNKFFLDEKIKEDK